MRNLTPQELRLGAGFSRVLFAVLGAAVMPVVYPSFAGVRPLLIGYGMMALLSQALIARGLGMRWRTQLMGVLDGAMLTYVVHWVGSIDTPLVAIYLYAALLNTLVAGRSVARWVTASFATMYLVLLGLELSGVLPYAPGGPAWLRGRTLGTAEALGSAVVTATLLALSVTIVGKLLDALAERELDLRRMNERLEQLSIRDALTNLFNRRHLVESVDRALASLTDRGSFAVIMIDLDGFKRINDAYGHQRGDALLREIADALGSRVRAGDLVCRYGGDEFVVVLWDATQAEAEIRARQLSEVVRDVGARFEPDVPVTASVGVSVARPGDATLALLRRADEHAYEAKRAGGNSVIVRRSAGLSGP